MIDTVLSPLYFAVAKVLLGWHWLFSQLGLDPNSGLTWALSIVGLTVVIRVILIPLFVKQIHASRKMAVIQPKVREITKKYKDDREKQSQELMKLYREEKTNPFASCLPLLLQSPVFISLFRVLEGAAQTHPHGRGLTDAQALNLHNATFLGAGISEKFTSPGTSLTVKFVTIVLIVAMSATTFVTQKQLTQKNLPPAALTGQFAQQQKLMLYAFPLVFAVTGVNFPIGVLLYWLTTNLWTGGQQYYVIKHNPTPGSAAWDTLQEKRRAAGKPPLPTGTDVASPPNGPVLAGAGIGTTATAVAEPPRPVSPGERQQPRRTTRSARTTGAPRPAARQGPRPSGARPAGTGGQRSRGGQRRPNR